MRWKKYSGKASFEILIFKALLILVVLVTSTSCAKDQFRSSLIPKNKTQATQSIYGAYTTLTIETLSGSNTVSGELIAIDDDTVFISTEFDFFSYPADYVKSASIILTENNARSYGTMTLIAAVPGLIGMMVHSEYAGGFAALTIPALVLGGLATLGESSRDPHVITYPSPKIESLTDISKYSRFPGGFPPELDRNMFRRPAGQTSGSGTY